MIEANEAQLTSLLDAAPVVAILRGVNPGECVAICEALFDSGIRVVEVPLNSPSPFESIALLRSHFDTRMVVGAGTVLTAGDVRRLARAGGQICVSPDCDPKVIHAAQDAGIVAVPGIATPTEAFRAVKSGARWLKLFPCGEAGLSLAAALKSVLPEGIRMVAVGGVDAANTARFLASGFAAVGIGSELYRPGHDTALVGQQAARIMAATHHEIKGSAPHLLANPRATISESPVLTADQKAMLFTDPVGKQLCRLTLADAKFDWQSTRRPINAIGWRNGTLIGLGNEELVELGEADADEQVLARASLDPGCRFNDMAIAPDGTAWAGTMHRALLAGAGSVYSFGIDGTAVRAFDGLGVCNGMAVIEEGTALALIDTLSRTLVRFPIEGVGNTLGQPKILSDFLGLPGKPDGMVATEEGHFLVAMWGAGELVELAADGALIARFRLPSPHVSSLCLAPDGDLLVTTSRLRLTPQRADATDAGGVFRISRSD